MPMSSSSLESKLRRRVSLIKTVGMEAVRCYKIVIIRAIHTKNPTINLCYLVVLPKTRIVIA